MVSANVGNGRAAIVLFGQSRSGTNAE